MANLNLTTGDVNKHGSGLNGGMAWIAGVLFLVIVLYAGLILMGKKYDSDIAKAKADNKMESEKIATGAASVADFQNRADTTDALMKNNKNVLDYVAEIEKLMVRPGMYLDKFSYNNSEKTISVTCIADNYTIVAKQIFNFKSSKIFSSVVPGGSRIDGKKQKISMDIQLTIK